jgi:drug/metabolite transporter (DMT)-like permease
MSSVWIAAFLVGGALLAWVPVPGRDGSVPRPPLQGPLVLTVLAGFGGVVLMLKPTVGDNQGFAGLMGLLSGLTAAFAYMQVVALSRLGEPEARTVFYFAVGSAVAGSLGTLLGESTPWSSWTWSHALWLLPVGVLAALGQLCMTRAYASAKTESGTLLVANLQYSGIVFAAMYSVLLFGDRIDAAGWAGMALIVASGIAATVLRQRSLPKAPAEEH